jgi:hypothetical protein
LQLRGVAKVFALLTDLFPTEGGQEEESLNCKLNKPSFSLDDVGR